jgi:predicted TIM-barrel fold metal-dependent hydrolase
MRNALLAIILCASGVVIAQPPAVSQPVAAELGTVFARTGVDISAVRVETPAAATFPLIDAHNHLNANMTAEALIDLMDRAGVEAMVLMPRHYRAPSNGGGSTDEQALAYTQRHPGRFIAFVGGQRDDLGPRSRVWRESGHGYSLLREFGEKLGRGRYRGLGEFILVHHAYDVGGGETGGEVRIRVDHDVMRDVAALAGRHRVPVLFHAEAEERPAEEAEALVAAFPDTLFIWAHNCGRASAEGTARRLRRFPNLMCDLGHMFNGPRTRGGYGKGWPRKTPWVHPVQDDAGRILPEMKQLFEAFPDRFVIGTDTAHTPYLRFYEYRIAIFRVMLAQLAPEAARRIGAENARRVFTRSAGRDGAILSPPLQPRKQ